MIHNGQLKQSDLSNERIYPFYLRFDIQMNIKPVKPPILYKTDTKAQRKGSYGANVVASA